MATRTAIHSRLPRHGLLNDRAVALAVGTVALVVFLPSLGAGFVYDDLHLIVDNQFAKSLSHLPRAFTSHFFDVSGPVIPTNSLQYYRPVVTLSYLLDWVISRGTPAYFHAFNVAVHAANCGLFVLALRRWLPGLVLPAVGALVFALHPTRTESVTWVAGRTDPLMTLFILLGLQFAHSAVQTPGKWAHWLAMGCAFALALLSKEPAVLFPLLLAVDGLVARGQSEAAQRRYRNAVLTTAGASAAYLLGRFLYFPVHSNILTSLTWRRGLATVAAYAERVAYPWPQTFFYRLPEGPTGYSSVSMASVLAGAAIVGLTSFGLVRLWFRDRAACLLLMAAIALLAPLLNFADSGLPFTTCDRFLYLPLGLVTGAALRIGAPTLRSLSQWAIARYSLGGVGVALLLLATSVNVARSADYASETSHWLHELSINPNNPLALEALSQQAANRGEPALAHDLALRLETALNRYPLLDRPGADASRKLLRLQLQAELTADGDTAQLQQIANQLVSLECPATLGHEGRQRLEHGRDATAADVAARLGQGRRAQALLKSIPFSALTTMDHPLRVLLTHARIGEFADANSLLQRVEAEGDVQAFPPQQVEQLKAQLSSAQRLRSQPPGPIGTARSLAELGAYGLAAKTLRPLSTTQEPSAQVIQLLAQLLVAARLESEALQWLSPLLGPGRAESVIASWRAQLPRPLQAIAPLAPVQRAPGIP